MNKTNKSVILMCLSIALLCQEVSSALQTPEQIAKSVEAIQKKFAASAVAKGQISSDKNETSDDTKNHSLNEIDELSNMKTDDVSPLAEGPLRNRRDKMLDYYGYYPAPSSFPYSAPFSYPMMPYPPLYPPWYQQPYAQAPPIPPTPYTPYYPSFSDQQQFSNSLNPDDEYDADDEYGSTNEIDDTDDGSRANNRRRKPSANNRNSPIFYIRLPPTPYMFVPGMGYISQPPSIQPIAPQYALPSAPPINPFINLPINYLSNAKPTGVYPYAQPTNYASPQYPSYLPSRPQRPYRPSKPFSQQDSKITHLKGSYIFNGRPEDIYLLPNPHYQAAFSSPYRYMHNPYQVPAPPNPYAQSYNPYSPIYSPPIPAYY